MKSVPLPVRYFRVFPGDNPHGHTGKEMPLDPAETVLLLVDVYHGVEKPQTKDFMNTLWDQAWWRIVEQNLTPVVQAVRKTSIPVVYVTNSSPRIQIKHSAFGQRLVESLGFDPTVDFREPDVNPLEFDCGEPVQLFIPAPIAPQPEDHMIRKHTYSGFFETRLDSLLRNLGARTLLVAGFVADCCVFFTIGDAVFRGYNTILLRDCTLGGELPDEVETFQHTERTIKLIESILGPSTTSTELIQALGEMSSQPGQGEVHADHH